MNNGRDCVHGRQIGKCDTCDLIDAEQRILELEAQVEQLKQDIDIGAKDYCGLMERHDALFVQVDQLRNLLIPATKLMRATAPSSGWHKTADEIEAVINSKLITESMNHVDEIKAQAVEEAYEDYKREYVGQGISQWFIGYVNQLRKQAKACE